MRAALAILAAVACAWPAPSASAQETEHQFVARCRREVVADDPRAAEWAHDVCQDHWRRIAATGPLLDAVLPLFASGAAPVAAPEALRAALPRLAWTRAEADDAAFQAGMGDLSAEILRTPPGRLRFGWTRLGRPIPYDVVEALRTRGARLTPIGCYALGLSESGAAWRVALPGHVPFALTIHQREAPTGDAWSSLSVAFDADRRIPSLAGLRAADPGVDWRAGLCG